LDLLYLLLRHQSRFGWGLVSDPAGELIALPKPPNFHYGKGKNDREKE